MNQKSLLVIVPSRGRPELCREMVESFLRTKSERTAMVVYLNTDDPKINDYRLSEDPSIVVLRGPRKYIAEVFNRYSKLNPDFDYYANLNDDHFFVTPGWDEKLIEINEKEMNGWGIACADDKLTDWSKHPHPSGCVISGKAIRLLGWIAPPGTRHIGIDVIQGKLFGGLGLLRFTKDVVIEHRHWINGMRPMDDNYRWVYSPEEQGHGDDAVQKYLYGQFKSDVEKLKRAMADETR